jgi:cytochrome c-type biogenesis protein CcmH/NrfG
MLSNGSSEEGVALLRQIVRTDPGNIQAHLMLAFATNPSNRSPRP